MSGYYLDIILPIALPRIFTYALPAALIAEAEVGKRAVVQFGKKKLYSGIVFKVHQNKPAYDVKDILSFLDEAPIVHEKQFDFWSWMSGYYLCSMGEVMSSALPSGLKLASETMIRLNANHPELKDKDTSVPLALPNREQEIVDQLIIKNRISLVELGDLLKRSNIFPTVRILMDKGLVSIDETLIEKFRDKKEIYISLSDQSKDEIWLRSQFDKLEKRSPKQLNLLMQFLKISMDEKEPEIQRSRLLAIDKGAAPALASLIKKAILSQQERVVGRLGNFEELPVSDGIVYSEEQKRAIGEIESAFEKHDVTLLHGVTSSGKTEVYIHFIEKALQAGKQVLYLLPEIALTSQLIRRLQKHFGNKVGVYHSRFSSNERVELWNNVLRGHADPNHYQVILGARSALFLPYNNLGLIIVDEEHEQSFKQQTPSPRYQARDASIVLAKQHGAKTLLGSATPSVESYFNAVAGKFGLVSMPLRYGGMEMPEICVVDLKEASRKKLMHTHFSQYLLDAIQAALDAKEQVILFQNRRGFAPYLECPSCDWSPSCINCDVTLVYHKQSNRLRCHYCGFQQELPSSCPACSDPAIKMMGFGTEKIEEDLALFFPKAKIGRLDIDTARSRESFHNIIYDFEKRKTDILVGTQMVTKGLDFDHVSTVGIMNADSMLKHPDFRACERSFQLMAQVSGRSGRRNRRGKVIIQAFQAYHPVINQVMANDYHAFYTQEISERDRFAFPPFVRLAELSLRHADARFLEHAANELVEELRLNLVGQDILGPQAPVISRVRNLFIQNILIKFKRDNHLQTYKSVLEQTILRFKGLEANRALLIQIDVDPL